MEYSLSQNLTWLRENKHKLLEKIDSMLDEPSGLTIESSWTEIETFIHNLDTYISPEFAEDVEEQMERFLTNTIETGVEINTTTVNAYSFYKKTSLKNIKIDGATLIENNAFQGCTGLKKVDMSTVKTISTSAFNGCTNLTTINAPEVTSIGSSSFASSGLPDLSGFQIDKLTSIGDNAFSNCTQLSGDILLNGKMTVGATAFSNCTNIDRIIITNDVTKVNNTILYSNNTSIRPSGYKLKYIACEQSSKPSSWGTYWNKVYENSSSYQWPTLWNASVKDWVFVYNNGMPDTYWTGRVLEEFPNEGTKEGYSFGGWYSEPTLTNKVSVPLTLATAVPGLYAKWLLDVTLMVYDLETLEWINKGTYALGTMTDIPSSKTLGYMVDKWYLDDTFTTELTDISQILLDSPIIYTSAAPTHIHEFDYTGTAQEIILEPGTYQLECWGAQGGNQGQNTLGNYLTTSGRGGYSKGNITLNEQITLFIYVGGKGGMCDSTNYGSNIIVSGGFNGGGTASHTGLGEPGNGGGGASDIRLGQDSLYARVIVAGGGGGSGEDDESGGYGGGQLAGIGYTCSNTTPASYTTGFKFGLGAHARNGGAGGGGWYGGNSSANLASPTYAGDGSDCGGGNGGSGYVYTAETAKDYPAGCLLNEDYYLSDVETIAGNKTFLSPDEVEETGHSGNGYVRITKIRS